MNDDDNNAIDAELGEQQLDDERERALDDMAVAAIRALDIERSIADAAADRAFDRLLTTTERELSETSPGR